MGFFIIRRIPHLYIRKNKIASEKCYLCFDKQTILNNTLYFMF
jgi:hypothetical protein